MAASFIQLVAIAHEHAQSEAGTDLDAIMRTMEGEPIYDFFPMGKRFVGVESTRRFYQHYLDDVIHRIKGAELHSESLGPSGVINEFTLTITVAGDTEPTRHRIMTLLTVGDSGITGERMFSDERLFRTLIGPLWDELVTIEP